jgi:hypothetical protein
MKNSIKLLLMVAVIFQVVSLKAQNTTTNGIYLNENDYRSHHLSYEISAADKLQLNDFLGGSNIKFTSKGQQFKMAKNAVFGYRLNNQDYRFYNNNAYRVLDTAGFLLYSKTELSKQGKGYLPVVHYFFSVNQLQPVLALTLENLNQRFRNQTDFRYSLQSYFRKDDELSAFDPAENQYKIKYVFFQHTVLAAHKN